MKLSSSMAREQFLTSDSLGLPRLRHETAKFNA